MLARGQIAAEPLERVKLAGVGAKLKNGEPAKTEVLENELEIRGGRFGLPLIVVFSRSLSRRRTT